MGNQKIWEPIVVVGGAVIGFSAIIYALFIYKKDNKDLFEVAEDEVDTLANKVKETVSGVYNNLTAPTQAGGSATKRHKKQSKGKGKSHKKH
jgi:hypothetical protein